MSFADIEGWLRISLTRGIGRSKFRTLISYFDSPTEIFSKSQKELTSIVGIDESTAKLILEAAVKTDVSQQLELLEKHKVKIITSKDSRYPQNLKYSSFAAPLLFVKGELKKEDKFSISVVGSRQITSYGKLACTRICSELAKMGVTIVSGMAQGIDSEAHSSALKAGGRTIAVLGNGLDFCYPAANKNLMSEIIENGAVISEYPMGIKPLKGNFPERNSIIAGMSLGVLVVEASKDSGSLITAACCIEDNRNVYAVPGDINRRNSEGANNLLRQGAVVVTSGYDIIEDMASVLRPLLDEEIKKEENKSEKITHRVDNNKNLSKDEKSVLEIIRSQPKPFEDIIGILAPKEFSIGKLSSLLLSLEIKGEITQLPGGIYSSVK